MICGDFNARCANETDYIQGVDDVPERHIIAIRTVMVIY